jgi:hypothetical protein
MNYVIVLAGIAALTCSEPGAAFGWNCRDVVDYPDGWSIMDQLYFDDGLAKIGPLYHVSRKGIYASWYPEPKHLGAPFKAPSLLSFDIKTPLVGKPVYGVFANGGGDRIKIAVSTFGRKDEASATRVLFQPKDRDTNGLLLSRQDWKIALYDKRPSGSADFRFPFSLSELEQTYWRHVASIKTKAKNKETECGENNGDAEII